MKLLAAIFNKKVPASTTLNKDNIKKKMMEKDPEYRETVETLAWQDHLIAVVQNAREQYEKDKNIDELIKTYEYVLLEAEPPIENMQGLPLALAELYRKNNQNDKAWGYLNRLLLTKPDLIGKIRFEQCKILKSEKKYTEAMKMLMCGYLFKSKWNQTFQREMFVREATPIANRLKWDTKKIEYLVHLIECQVDRKDYDEGLLIENYKKALEQFEK